MTMPPQPSCCFYGCPKPASLNSVKCVDHRHRAQCVITDCHNQVYARGLCVRHGGKKQCVFAGCQGNARAGPFCSKHRPIPTKKRLCSAGGCGHVARVKGLCVSHGGGRKCHADGCDSFARNRGLCRRHHIERLSSDATELSVTPSTKVEDLSVEMLLPAILPKEDVLDAEILTAVFEDAATTTLNMEPITVDWIVDCFETSVLEVILSGTVWC
ncbi:Aste57867_1796 [Aphanomyces stellatus]|uniref:Aste57867_1796 protein n=1 Tax=Aphanomyces stellatus TaxID=120398 RepID=A0A485K651_9STRA|nr:hypothetical protein As57867_001794 [Aphanomyces stellatus]VFT79005.1 Aste57867_1796 [Aphanomyces stellatus]